jgi:hypothetical protein
MNQDTSINTAALRPMQSESAPPRKWRGIVARLVFAAVGIGGGVAVALGGIEAVFTAIGHTAPAIPNNFRTGLASSWLMLWLGGEWMISSISRVGAKRRSLLVSALISVGLAAMVAGLALAFAK